MADNEILAAFVRGGRRNRRQTINPPEANNMDGSLNQGVPIERSNQTVLTNLLETLVGVTQQQVMTGANLTQLLGQQQHQPRNALSEFKKLSPPYFDDSVDPLVAENWLQEVEKAFEALGCTDAEKVRLASYQLRGRSYDWWQMVKATSEQAVETYTWGKFKEMFYENYFPRSVRQQKEREFIELKQGNMSVAEYQAKFLELAKFARKLVDDEESKARRFEEGLRPRIKQGVVPFELTTFSAVIGKALLVERGLNEIQRDREDNNQKKRSYSSSFPEGQGPSGQGKRRNREVAGQGQKNYSQQKPPVKC